jgi:hypothetical protein
VLLTPVLALGLLAAAPEEVTPVSWALVGAVCFGAAAAGRAWTTGRPLLGARIFSGSLLCSALFALYFYGGVESASSVSLITAVAVAGVLLGRRALVMAGLAAFVAVLAVSRLEALGLMPDEPPPSIALSTATMELGVLLLIDDFGTGWSSLSYVQSYPVDVVKIDRAFIMTIDEDGGHVLAATIKFMAAALGLQVVAEGIETQTQYHRLREMDVELGQGYHFSRPLPAEDAQRLLRPRVAERPSGIRAVPPRVMKVLG